MIIKELMGVAIESAGVTGSCRISKQSEGVEERTAAVFGRLLVSSSMTFGKYGSANLKSTQEISNDFLHHRYIHAVPNELVLALLRHIRRPDKLSTIPLPIVYPVKAEDSKQF